MVEDTMFSGESKNIEYKVSLPDKSEKYMKTIVAFANRFYLYRWYKYILEEIRGLRLSAKISQNYYRKYSTIFISYSSNEHTEREIC